MRFRLSLIFLLLVAYFLIVMYRLVQLQLLPNPRLESLLSRQLEKVSRKASFRLPIFDRYGEELAVSLPSHSVFARPKLIKDKMRTARTLASLLGGGDQRWLKKLRTKKPFVWIERQLDEAKASQLMSLKLTGIYVEPENKRLYPNGILFANTLGFADIDGNGLWGLERSMNELLLQRPLKLRFLRDGRGKPSYIEDSTVGVEKTGVYTTLDRRLQHAMEEELDATWLATKAKAVLGIIIVPSTGEILAMGQRPTFDPNRPGQYSPYSYHNRFLSNLFEPGSTLKVLIAAEAIEQGLLHRNSLIDCGGGQIKIGPKTISEADTAHRYGLLPLEKVIRFSSNVGAVRIAQMLGTDRVRATIDKFGLTSKTGVGLSGELTGSAKGDGFWGPVFLATVGFGQGVSVTPLQLASAYSVFANGGSWVRPKILLNHTQDEREGLNSRRVITPRTAEIIKEILISVTEEKGGTGLRARIPGIRVAGKTGTAQKYALGEGYGGGSYVSSFIGFLPADKPEILAMVVVDEPQGRYYASEIAAPLFQRVAERSLQILDRIPRSEVVELDRGEEGEDIVRTPTPIPTYLGTSMQMPDLKGISMREALAGIGKHFENIRFEGSGFLERQIPSAGTLVTSTTPVVLRFVQP